MKKNLLFAFSLLILLFFKNDLNAQAFKAGVFDIDVMVQAMPGYRTVDSLTQVFEKDSLGAQYEYNVSEYQRLDSMFKADSALVATGKKPKAIFDIVVANRQKIGMELVYWQQIAQNRSNDKRAALSQKLYQQVAEAYKKVLARKKYTLILKPNSYEIGFPIDNIFMSVGRELKLASLPNQLIYLGDDPDAVKPPQTQKQPAANKPKN